MPGIRAGFTVTAARSGSTHAAGEAQHNLRMTKTKRGYSSEFPIDQSRRIKREIDWVPPALDRTMRAKLKRDGLSLRTLTLRLWKEWVER